MGIYHLQTQTGNIAIGHYPTGSRGLPAWCFLPGERTWRDQQRLVRRSSSPGQPCPARLRAGGAAGAARPELQLRLRGLWLPTRPAQITRLARRGRAEAGAASAAVRPALPRAPRQLRANRPAPQISAGKAAIWQLRLPWRKARQSWKTQEFLDLLARPRKTSSPPLLRRCDGHCGKLSPCPGGHRPVP